MIWVHTDDFSPSQMGVHRTRISAAITCSEMAGHSSRSHPCSVMSGHTPVAMSWSMARIDVDGDPLAPHDLHRDGWPGPRCSRSRVTS